MGTVSVTSAQHPQAIPSAAAHITPMGELSPAGLTLARMCLSLMMYS